MGSEGASGLWGRVRDGLGRYGRLGRIENGVEAGWADVLYCLNVPARPAVTGFLELKHMPSWPKRPGTPVLVPSLTLDQVRFLEDWTQAGTPADLLMQVGPTYVLLDAAGVRALYERELTQAHVLMTAHVVGLRGLPARELVRHLTRPRAVPQNRALQKTKAVG